jgi:hypothetical protein
MATVEHSAGPSRAGLGRLTLRLLCSRPVGLTRTSIFGGIFAAWIIAALLTALDLVWCKIIGIRVVGFAPVLGSVAAAVFGSVAYRVFAEVVDRFGWAVAAEGCRRGGVLLAIAAVVIALSNGFALLSYLLASLGLPLVDEQLAQIDSILGFDWLAWFEFAHSRPWVWFILANAYASTLPAVGFALFYLILQGQTRRCYEMLWILS